MNSILLLSGPVGSGKTTVARELLLTAPGPTAYIEGDIFWSFIAKPVPGRPRGEDFKTIMRAMLRASLVYARDGYETILDFSIPPWYLDAAQEKIKDVAIHYVVLLPSEEVCAARAAARADGAIADYAPHRDLYSSFSGVGRNAISDDQADAETIATRIRNGLGSGIFRISS